MWFDHVAVTTCCSFALLLSSQSPFSSHCSLLQQQLLVFLLRLNSNSMRIRFSAHSGGRELIRDSWKVAGRQRTKGARADEENIHYIHSRRLECEWNMWRVQLFRCSMGVGRNWARRPRSILPSYLWYCVQRVLRMAQALGLAPSAEVQVRHGWLAG